MQELIYANGINASTGAYLTPPQDSRQLVDYITHEKPPDYQGKLEERERRADDFRAAYGVDPKQLNEAGWGVIYATPISDAVKEALSPLVNLRKEASGPLFQTYTYRGESSREFLQDNNVSIAGPAEPKEMPYYILLVGSPEEIPYDFQVELDVDRAVGRIYFDTVEEYDNYARSVVAAEQGEIRLPRRAAFFGVQNEGDHATGLSTDLLVEPLFRDFKEAYGGDLANLQWDIRAYLRDEARRSQLERILGGDSAETPALLFAASHGLGFDLDDERQLAHQGALLCSDWEREPGRIPEKFYVAGQHIGSDARLHGLISFFFACYGAGTPSHDEFMRKVEGQPERIAPKSFVAGLPRRMLSHPRGGALAVIGHVERAWTYSFKKVGEEYAHRAVFESTLAKLMDGYPVGDAFDYFNGRHASASVQLTSLLEDKRYGSEVNDLDLIQMWMINNDARYYVILGDPAVRLCVAQDEDDAARPSGIELHPIDLVAYLPGHAFPSPLAAGKSEIADLDNVDNAKAERESPSMASEEATAEAYDPEDPKTQLSIALQNLMRQISAALQNASRLEILTYLGDDDLENSYRDGQISAGAQLGAVTVIEANGQIKSIIPDRGAENEDDERGTVEADERLLRLHAQMVSAARTNQAKYLKTLSETAVTLLKTKL